jgi:general secretion pathway protein J
MRKNCRKKRQEARGKGQGGFTLLELRIAITILSLVTLMIGSGFRLGYDAWEKGEAETIETQRLRVLSGLLSQQIKSSYPYKMEIEDENVIVFKGDADSIMFVTTLTDSSYGGFKWVRYFYKDESLLYKEGFLPDKEFMKKISGKEEIIDSDIEEVKFKYYSNEQEEWKESWDFAEELPGAISVKISHFQPFQITIPMSIAKKDEEGSEIL